MDEFFAAVADAAEEYRTEYVPALLEVAAAKKQEAEAKRRADLDRLKADLLREEAKAKAARARAEGGGGGSSRGSGSGTGGGDAAAAAAPASGGSGGAASGSAAPSKGAVASRP
jgi:hypothetical protein